MAVKYIFSISTGRSGSDYLSRLFSHVDGVHSEHEAKPVLNREPMVAYLDNRKEDLRKLVPSKLEAIYSNQSNNIYVETNHCFIKGFGWEICEILDPSEIGIVILTRASEKIVSSYLRIGGDPLEDTGLDWMITPRRKNLVPPPISRRTFAFLHRLLKFYYWFLNLIGFRGGAPFLTRPISRKLLYWYILETKALTEEFKAKFPNIRYYEIDIEMLNNKANFEKLLANFGIPAKNINSSIETLLGKPSNLKTNSTPRSFVLV